MSETSGQKSFVQDGGGLALTRAIGCLPHGAALALGAGAGRMLCALAAKKRRRIEANLTGEGLPTPPPSAWEAGAHIGRTMAEMAWLLWQTPERIDATTEIEGLDAVKEAVADGRGVLLASAHLGNWELGVRAVARCGTPVNVIARALGSPRVEAQIARFRESGGVHTLTRGAPGASVAAYRTLRNGHVLACMMDRMSSGRRIDVPFIGARLKIPLGPVVLALRARSRIVVGGTRRLADGSSQACVRALPRVPENASVEDVARQIAGELNAMVSRDPDQWYWIYRRPKRVKAGDAKAEG